jgi:glucan 1,3-beta-glucosidase
MAVLQASIAIFVAHIILLLGFPASLVAAVPVAVPVSPANVLATTEKRAPSSYWVANIKRQGVIPFAKTPDYKIFRNVKDYGAKGQSFIQTLYPLKTY